MDTEGKYTGYYCILFQQKECTFLEFYISPYYYVGGLGKRGPFVEVTKIGKEYTEPKICDIVSLVQ